MAKTNPINIANPQGGSDPKLGDDYIRTLAKAVLELIEKDHFIGAATDSAYDEADAGEHSKITFHAPLAANPTNKTENSDETDSHEGYLYLKDIENTDEENVAELHFQDENGNHIQMSAQGYNYLEKPLMPNNTIFKAINATGDGLVELWKLNASGVFEFRVKARLLADTTAVSSSTLLFTSGSTEIIATNIITGETSGHTATVKSITLSSGSWAGGDAAGSMQLNNVSGAFTESEELSVGAATEIATAGVYTVGETGTVTTEEYVDAAIAAIPSMGDYTTTDSLDSALEKDEVYKVGSDGFITAYTTAANNYIYCKIGDSNTPSTYINKIGGLSNYGCPGLTIPIKKDNYFKIESNGTPTIYWTPFGGGECVKQ